MWKRYSTALQTLAFSLFPMGLIFYFSLTNIIPRNTCFFLDKTKQEDLNLRILVTTETGEKVKIRKKIIQDFQYHKSTINWNKTILTKILVNQEGKIIGYKLYNVFYPNYFTKTQIKSLIKSSHKMNQNFHPIDVIRLSGVTN